MTRHDSTLRLAAAALLLCLAASGCDRQPPQTGTEPAKDESAAAAPSAMPPAADAAASPVADAVTPVGDRSGEEVFALSCRACHSPGAAHPGTMMLGSKKGEAQSVILNRPDLPAEYITHVVRNGLLEMPPQRPTDVTDEELQRLVEYIRTTPADKIPPEPSGGAYVYLPPPGAGGPPPGAPPAGAAPPAAGSPP